MQSGYRLEVELSGFDQFKAKLQQAPQLVAEVKFKMMDRMVTIARDKAVSEAPIDTGNLRQNLAANSKVVTMGNDFYGVVGTNLVANGYPYPQAQEFGTGIYGRHGIPIVPKRKKFLVFKPKGSSKYVFAKSVKGIKPKFFMKKAMEEVKSRVGEIMQIGAEIVNKLSF
jgi:HK97 gp10 family phage protein